MDTRLLIPIGLFLAVLLFVLARSDGSTVLPPTLAGSAGQFLAVNADETALVLTAGDPGPLPPFDVAVYRGDTATCLGMATPVDGEYRLWTRTLTPPAGWQAQPAVVEDTDFVRCRAVGRVYPSSDVDADGVVAILWFRPVAD